MIYRIKKLLFRILPTSLYLAVLQRGFFLLFDLGLLKKDSRFKFHYASRKLIQPTDIVLDIGANLGYFSKLFARRNYKGKLYSIEPIPLFFNRLKKILSSYTHVELVHSALGSNSGTLFMVMPVQQGVIRTGLPHVISEEEAKVTPGTIQVPVLEARAYLSTFDRLDFIKCDIEGYEWTVFSSISDEINRLRPIIQIEISETHIDNFVDYFRSLNYKQCGLYSGELILEEGKQKETSDFLFVPVEKLEKIFSKFKG